MLSPNKIYKLDVANYKTKGQPYRNCIITKADTDSVIAIIDKPSPENQDFLWFAQNNNDWLQFGQTFVHLESGQIHNGLPNNFSWIKTYANPNANILAVTDYKQFKFFDISQLSRGLWTEFKLNLVDYCEYTNNCECEWDDNNTFIIKDIKYCRIRMFRKNDNEMVNIKVYDLKN